MSQLRCRLTYRKVALCIAALCCATALRAQIAFGVKGGGNFSRLALSNESSTWINSYHIGMGLNMYIAEFRLGGFAVQPEVLYNNKGASSASRDDELSYLEIPLGLIYLLNFGNVVPYISVAPYYSFLLAQKSEYFKTLHEESSYYNRDYGVKLGGGVELRRFQVSVAYSLGLCNISKAQTAYNRSIEISLGYFLQ